MAQRYADAARKAIAYLSERVLDDAWVAGHGDVAYYFKAPVAYLEADDGPAAAKALDILVAEYVDCGGASSKNVVYATVYPHYPWMWMCWSATRLDRKDLAKTCFEKLFKYVDAKSCAGRVPAPLPNAEPKVEFDFFATAEVMKVAVLVGSFEVAEKAADTLVEVIQANGEHMKGGRFYLRWVDEQLDGKGGDGSEKASPALIHAEDPFHCVRQDSPGQLYFMMAFPVMMLLELSALVPAKPGQSKAFGENATKLLGFLKECNGVYESPMAHKVAVAAAMAKDFETAAKIADYLLTLQQPAGCFQMEPDAMDSLDQTAEIAAWLFQVQRMLV